MAGQPTQSDPTRVLFAHDRWATRTVLESCRALSPDQFSRRFEIGPGSLHDTLAHIIAATRSWKDVLERRPFRERPEDKKTNTVDELLALHETACDEFVDAVDSRAPDESFERGHGELTYRFTPSAAFAHVVTHGMHHRAQCLNMLRRLGVEDLPRVSVMAWTFTDPPGSIAPGLASTQNG